MYSLGKVIWRPIILFYDITALTSYYGLFCYIKKTIKNYYILQNILILCHLQT